MSRRGLTNLLFWIVFSQLVLANELIDAASGAYHSLLLFKDGRIATVEHFERDVVEKFHFSYVESPIKFISIAAGENFNLAVSAEGSLWGWIVSRLVRNFVPEKSRKSIMLRQTESPFEVLLNRHSYSNAQSASRLNTQADSLLSVLYKNPLRGKCRQQRSAFEFHG